MSAGPAAPAPLAVYVHWPYCARICPYCDFNVVRDRGRQGEQADLARAIVADLAGQAARTGPRRLVSIYFGGGTPSLMEPDAVAAVVAQARRLWAAGGDLEVTLEANPTDAEAGRFSAFAAAGVNRLSLGVQALEDADLAFLGRNHDAATARRALAAAAAAFPRVSLDLIYALPGQTPAAWAATLREAAGLGAGHLSPYQLTLEPGTPFDRAVARGRFAPADADLAADLYETTQTTLEALGFEAYEVSNHARGLPERSRHNLAYWRGEDYLGVGPGAHGRSTDGEGRVATFAHARIVDYTAAVRDAGEGVAERERLSPGAVAEERLLMGLRTREGVGFGEVAVLGLHPASGRVAALHDAEMLTRDPQRLVATPAGRRLLDAVIRALVVG